MSGSCIQGKSNIKSWLGKQKDIRVIVDVGAGSATYPKLLGDRYKYKAIEIWAPYVRQWDLERYYDEVRIGDARYIRFPKGDCVIFGDVLEHINKRGALKVLGRAEKFYPHTIVSVPLSVGKKIREGEIHYSNWFEKHRSAWNFDELNKMFDWDLAIEIGKNHMGIFAK